MTDKEKIRADVSKLIIPESECNGMSLMGKGRQYAYREVLGIIDSTSEEPVSEDLEEEIGRYFKENGNKWAYIDVARHFANWQKQQMMKDAVPATVLTNQYGNKYIRSWSGLREYNKFKNGDEVKVYLIKED